MARPDAVAVPLPRKPDFPADPLPAPFARPAVVDVSRKADCPRADLPIPDAPFFAAPFFPADDCFPRDDPDLPPDWVPLLERDVLLDDLDRVAMDELLRRMVASGEGKIRA